MGFMRPTAKFMVVYHVETNCGTELVPEEVCGKWDVPFDEIEGGALEHFKDYIEGNQIEAVERHEGWYSRLSADGYMDCTDWHGPFSSQSKALAEIQAFHDMDANGDDVNEQSSETD